MTKPFAKNETQGEPASKRLVAMNGVLRRGDQA